MEKDILRLEGVKSRGYGIVAKIVMKDEDITAQAKALYALITSFASNGNTYMPSRDKLIAWLGIAKNTYYKYFKELKVAGLITVTQKNSNGSFGVNTYTIKERPTKYLEGEYQTSKKEYSEIQIVGIYGIGYGIIPKIPMQDSRLDIYSKAIYAYFCSIAGSGNKIFPESIEVIKALGINQKTYNRYLKQLKDYNYITVKQKKSDTGEWRGNNFYLNQFPSESPLGTDCDTVIQPLGTDCDTVIQLLGTDCDTVIQPLGTDCDTVSQPLGTDCDTVSQPLGIFWDTLNCDTYNNNIYNNNIYNNSLSLSKDNKIKNIITELKFNRGIPYDYKIDKENMTTAIHFLTDWDSFVPNGFFNVAEQQLYELTIEILIEMCCTAMMILKGKDISYTNVIDKINIISKGEKCGLWVFVTDSMRLFKDAIRGKNIKNYSGYMRSFLWDYLSTYCIEKEKILGNI